MSRRLVTVSAVIVALTAAIVTALSVSYVTTHGSSMEPTYSDGDLVVLRQAESYGPGDVVAYRSEQLRTQVMHRITGGDAGALVLQGDNNSWRDPDHPSVAQLDGKAWFHIPRGGQALAWITGHWPTVAAGLIVGAALIRGRVTPRPKLRTGHPMPTRSDGSTRARQQFAGGRHQVRVVAACALAGALLLGAYAVTQPTATTRSDAISFAQQGEFSYTGTTPAGPAYPAGVISTADPIYLRVASSLTVKFSYAVTAPASHDVDGLLSLHLTIAAPGGWTRDVELGTPSKVEASTGVVDATLDLARVRSIIDEMAAATGIQTAAYTVEVVASADISGKVAGQPVEEESRFTLPFRLDSLQLRPDWAASAAGADPLRPVRTKAVRVRSQVPRALEIGPVHFKTAHLLPAAAVGAGAAIIALLASIAPARRRRSGEAARIANRHGHRIVSIVSSTRDGGHVIIETGDMNDLARLAAQYDCLILHEPTTEHDRYTFQLGDTEYRYTTKRWFGTIDAPHGGDATSPSAAA